MRDDAERAAPASRPRWWAWGGWGFARSLDEVRFRRDVGPWILVALTVWGYVDISRRGRIIADINAHRTDFTVYTEAGAAFFDGRDPYRVTNPRGWFYLYPPLFALMVAPLAALDSQAQVVAWYVVSIALGFGCYLESRKLWRLAAPPREAGPTRLGDLSIWVGGSLVLAVFWPTLECLQRGQVGVALLYPMLLGLRLTLAGRTGMAALLGGVALAWPVAVKLLPALSVGVLLAQRWAAVLTPGRRSRIAGGALALSAGVGIGGFLFLLALPAACIGWGKNVDALRTWTRRVAANPDPGRAAGFHTESIRNQSLANATFLLADTLRGTAREDSSSPLRRLVTDRQAAHRRRSDRLTDRVAWGGRVLALTLLLAIALAAGLRRDGPGQAAGYGLACAAIPLISPLAWSHYFVLLLPAILSAAPYLARRGRPAQARALAALPAVLLWVHYTAMPWAGPIGLLGLGLAAWFFAAGVLILRVLARTEPEPAMTRWRSAVRIDTRHDPAPHRPRVTTIPVGNVPATARIRAMDEGQAQMAK